MKTRVYFSKTKDPNDWAKEGFDLMPVEYTGDHYVVFKEVELPADSPLVKTLINCYNSEGWQKYFFGGNKETVAKRTEYMKSIGCNFFKNDSGIFELDLTDDAWKALCRWRIEIDIWGEERLLRLAPFDIFFPNPLYPTKWIDPYIKDSAKEWMDKGLLGTKYLES